MDNLHTKSNTIITDILTLNVSTILKWFKCKTRCISQAWINLLCYKNALTGNFSAQTFQLWLFFKKKKISRPYCSSKWGSFLFCIRYWLILLGKGGGKFFVKECHERSGKYIWFNSMIGF